MHGLLVNFGVLDCRKSGAALQNNGKTNALYMKIRYI